MRIITWNINGIRAIHKKGFKDNIKNLDPDILLLQEIKADKYIIKSNDFKMDKYFSVYNSAVKRGYSGTSIYAKHKPVNIIERIGNKQFDDEGRMIALEYNNFYVVNIYLPHTGRKLENMSKKLVFNKAFFNFCNDLKNKKPIIIGGDFNVAHKPIDLARPKDNIKNAGFTPLERDSFDRFLQKNYIDSFRLFNQKPNNYTWWSYRFDARSRNIGWRIDYLIVDRRLAKKLKKSSIHKDIYGSDHCPSEIDITL